MAGFSWRRWDGNRAVQKLHSRCVKFKQHGQTISNLVGTALHETVNSRHSKCATRWNAKIACNTRRSKNDGLVLGLDSVFQVA